MASKDSAIKNPLTSCPFCIARENTLRINHRRDGGFWAEERISSRGGRASEFLRWVLLLVSEDWLMCNKYFEMHIIEITRSAFRLLFLLLVHPIVFSPIFSLGFELPVQRGKYDRLVLFKLLHIFLHFAIHWNWGLFAKFRDLFAKLRVLVFSYLWLSLEPADSLFQL